MSVFFSTLETATSKVGDVTIQVRALIRIGEGVANDRCCNVSVLRCLRKDSAALALEMALNTLEPLVNRILQCKNYFKKHSFAQITKCFTLFHFLDCTFLTLCRNCISDHCRWSSHCGGHIAPHSGLIPRPLFTCLAKSSLGMRPQAPVFGRLQFADLYSIVFAHCMQSKTGMRLISNYYFTRNSQVYMSSLSSSIAPLSLLPPHPTHTHHPISPPSLSRTHRVPCEDLTKR